MSSQQIIFIDESGDPGLKTDRGASRLLVIACVVFNGQFQVKETRRKIAQFKSEQKWKQAKEIKFHKTTPDEKEKFFKSIKDCDLNIFASIIDKEEARKMHIKKSEDLYKTALISTLRQFKEMKNASVVLDGAGGRGFRRKVTSNLRKELNDKDRKRIKSFKLEESKNETLIQLADMIAGAIHENYNQKKEKRDNCLKYIKKRIRVIYQIKP